MTDLATPPPVTVTETGVVLLNEDYDRLSTIDDAHALAILAALQEQQATLSSRVERRPLVQALGWVGRYVEETAADRKPLPSLSFDQEYIDGEVRRFLSVTVSPEELHRLAVRYCLEPSDVPRWRSLSGREDERELRIEPFPGLRVVAHYTREAPVEAAEPEQVSA